MPSGEWVELLKHKLEITIAKIYSLDSQQFGMSSLFATGIAIYLWFHARALLIFFLCGADYFPIAAAPSRSIHCAPSRNEEWNLFSPSQFKQTNNCELNLSCILRNYSLTQPPTCQYGSITAILSSCAKRPSISCSLRLYGPGLKCDYHLRKMTSSPFSRKRTAACFTPGNHHHTKLTKA